MTETASRSAGSPVFQLMYRSRNRLGADDRGDELADLFARSRSNNQRRGVTGALLVSGQWFVQVLEGDEAVVRSLFDTIRTDARHDGVEVLWTEPAGPRTFAQWSMAQVGIPDSDLPLIAQISEITPGSHMTAEKRRLLDTMRESLDDGSGS
jgi:IS5 family transposase